MPTVRKLQATVVQGRAQRAQGDEEPIPVRGWRRFVQAAAAQRRETREDQIRGVRRIDSEQLKVRRFPSEDRLGGAHRLRGRAGLPDDKQTDLNGVARIRKRREHPELQIDLREADR